jgi:hypothetical protein
MNIRVWALVLFAIAPGVSAIAVCTYYLFPEWATLDKSHRNYQQFANSGADLRSLSIAEAAENRHRINCFAEGVGVLMGGMIFSIGVHGLCTLPKSQTL